MKLIPDTKFFYGSTVFESHKMFYDKRVIIFGLPGAFTPVCSDQHLPDFEKLFDEFKNYDIDGIYCVSVNDYFVMNAWFNDLNISKVRMLPDSAGDFTRQMGMLVKKDNLGLGLRSWRYSMLVEDHKIISLFPELKMDDNVTYDVCERSSAAYMLEYVKHLHKSNNSSMMYGGMYHDRF